MPPPPRSRARRAPRACGWRRRRPPSARRRAPAPGRAVVAGPARPGGRAPSGPARWPRSQVGDAPADRAAQPFVDVDVELEVMGLAVLLDAAIEAEAVPARLAVEPGASQIAVAPEEPPTEAEGPGPQLQIEVERALGARVRWRGAVVVGERGDREHEHRSERSETQPRLHPASPLRRRRISSGVQPRTRTSLSRPRAPRSIVTAEGDTSSATASRAASAVLARPSTGGAATRTLNVPSARQPTISLRGAWGWTRTRNSRSTIPARRPRGPRTRAGAGSAPAWRRDPPRAGGGSASAPEI